MVLENLKLKMVLLMKVTLNVVNTMEKVCYQVLHLNMKENFKRQSSMVKEC
jgi:hypothetical protein